MEPQQMLSIAVARFKEAQQLEELKVKMLAEAERACNDVIAQYPVLAQAHNILGAIYFKQGKYEVALERLRFAVAIGHDQLDLHLELIQALLMLGRLDEVIAASEAMVLCLPRSGTAYKVLSDAYKRANRINDASKAFGAALALDPSIRQVRQGETYKAKARRIRDGFFDAYCMGRGLDIGWGGDLLAPNCEGWEFEHGDSELLAGLDDESFDFVYSSHNLEHLVDPEKALGNWWRVVKPGGHLIVVVPHRDLYEKRTTLPSRWAPDHRHFFLPDRDDPPDTIGLEPLLRRRLANADIVYIKTCAEGHTIVDPNIHSDGEYSIEAVVRKAFI